MSKPRKQIDLASIEGFSEGDLANLYSGNPCFKSNLESVGSEPVDFDSEKGYQTERVIFELYKDIKDYRTATDEYYEGEMERWGAGHREFSFILTQTFPKEVTTTIYE